MTPVYYRIFDKLYRKKQLIGSAYEVVQERVVDNAQNGSSLVNKSERYASKGETMDKVRGTICNTR